MSSRAQRCFEILARHDQLFMFALALISAPIFLVSFLFIFIIGQLLVVLAMILTLYYLKLRRSMKLALSWLAGNLTFVLFIVLCMQLIKLRLDVVLFLMLVSGIPYCAAYCTVIGAAIWLHLNPPGFDRQSEHRV